MNEIWIFFPTSNFIKWKTAWMAELILFLNYFYSDCTMHISLRHLGRCLYFNLYAQKCLQNRRIEWHFRFRSSRDLKRLRILFLASSDSANINKLIHFRHTFWATILIFERKSTSAFQIEQIYCSSNFHCFSETVAFLILFPRSVSNSEIFFCCTYSYISSVRNFTFT